MGKKNLTKTSAQRKRLQTFFLNRASGFWTREQIDLVSSMIGLTRQQVYKWLWDRKKMQKEKTQKVKFEQEWQSDQSMEQYQYEPINYKNYEIHVPNNKQQAISFEVHPEVSMWAVHILKTQGWQLIRDRPKQYPIRKQYQKIESEQDQTPLNLVKKEDENRYSTIEPCDSPVSNKPKLQEKIQINQFLMISEKNAKDEIIEPQS